MGDSDRLDWAWQLEDASRMTKLVAAQLWSREKVDTKALINASDRLVRVIEELRKSDITIRSPKRLKLPKQGPICDGMFRLGDRTLFLSRLDQTALTALFDAGDSGIPLGDLAHIVYGADDLPGSTKLLSCIKRLRNRIRRTPFRIDTKRGRVWLKESPSATTASKPAA